MEVSFKGNKEAERVINLITHTNRSVFLTGKAGTGKSTLLHHIISNFDKNYVLLAPTGIAALNIGGQTIHSFFGFSIRPYLPYDRELPNLQRKKKLLHELDLIVIDEVSMVRVDIMNAIDLALKKAMNNKLPFGGKQILLIGDLLQLPPVINSKNYEEANILKENYATAFFFSAHVFDDFELDVIELQKVYRQEQTSFIQILNNIRVNQVQEADLANINSRYAPQYIAPDNKDIITLTTKNSKVNQINAEKLAKLDKTEFHFNAKKDGTFSKGKSKALPTDSTLKFKEDAQVMFIKNDTEKKRWVNGTVGKISSISAEHIEVTVGGKKHTIDPTTWEDVQFKWDEEEGKVEKDVVGTFTQYPIKLAWAITIHKSQGQTFEEVIIDLDSGAFASGQTYVALSRCTSLEGIVLKERVTRRDIRIEVNAARYLQEKGRDTRTKRDSIEASFSNSLRNMGTKVLEKSRQLEEQRKLIRELKQAKAAAEAKATTLEEENMQLRQENKSLKKQLRNKKNNRHHKKQNHKNK